MAHKSILASVAIAATLLLTVGLAQEGAEGEARDLSATVKALEGDARVQAYGAEERVNAQPGMRIAGGDEMFTGLDSRMDLELADGDYVSSVVSVGPLTACTLVAFARTQENIRTRLFLKQGTLKAGVTKGTIAADFTIETPQAVAAVTGTKIARVEQSPDRGFSLQMGSSGSLNISDPQNRKTKSLGPGDKGTDKFWAAVDEAKLRSIFGLMPLGYTPREMMAVFNSNGRLNFVPTERISRRDRFEPDPIKRNNEGMNPTGLSEPMSTHDDKYDNGEEPFWSE